MRAGNTTPQQRGFTFIALLVMLLLIALASQSVMGYVSQQAQRERESELLAVGLLYVQAIGTYYEASPGVAKQWPRDLQDLIEDRRLVTFRRYIRELYPDPITRQADWELIRAADGGIMGLRSRSMQPPIRGGAVALDGLVLTPAKQYADWEFIHTPKGGVQ